MGFKEIWKEPESIWVNGPEMQWEDTLEKQERNYNVDREQPIIRPRNWDV